MHMRCKLDVNEMQMTCKLYANYMQMRCKSQRSMAYLNINEANVKNGLKAFASALAPQHDRSVVFVVVFVVFVVLLFLLFFVDAA